MLGHIFCSIFRVASLTQEQNGRTALVQAIEGGHENTAKALLDAARASGTARRLAEAGVSASSNADRNRAGRSPLHLACAKGLTAVVTALLSAGVTVDGRDDDGETPLLYVCRQARQVSVV